MGKKRTKQLVVVEGINPLKVMVGKKVLGTIEIIVEDDQFTLKPIKAMGVSQIKVG